MKQFQNILFVSNGINNETEALCQAVQLAIHNHSSLDILIVCPLFPHEFEQYKTSYELFLKENINKIITVAKSDLPINQRTLATTIDIIWEKTPSIEIIRRVLRQSYDLVIKAAEDGNNKGFKAMDMALLRKCPCPLFLHRPLKHTREIHVAVAIDPNNEDTPGQDLTLNLLHLTYYLAKFYHGEFSIISCWDFPLEHFFRHSANMPQDTIEELLLQKENSNYLALNKVLQAANSHRKPTIYHLKGDPTELIPELIIAKEIDVLVMGTVARTGISGFIIGNTAENILQKLDCSLWAIKPQGFISPVKTY